MTSDQARLALIILYGALCGELRREHERLELQHRIAELREADDG